METFDSLWRSQLEVLEEWKAISNRTEREHEEEVKQLKELLERAYKEKEESETQLQRKHKEMKKLKNILVKTRKERDDANEQLQKIRNKSTTPPISNKTNSCFDAPNDNQGKHDEEVQELKQIVVNMRKERDDAKDQLQKLLNKSITAPISNESNSCLDAGPFFTSNNHQGCYLNGFHLDDASNAATSILDGSPFITSTRDDSESEFYGTLHGVANYYASGPQPALPHASHPNVAHHYHKYGFNPISTGYAGIEGRPLIEGQLPDFLSLNKVNEPYITHMQPSQILEIASGSATQRQASDARLKSRAEMLKTASGSKRGVKREFDTDVESSATNHATSILDAGPFFTSTRNDSESAYCGTLNGVNNYYPSGPPSAVVGFSQPALQHGLHPNGLHNYDRYGYNTIPTGYAKIEDKPLIERGIAHLTRMQPSHIFEIPSGSDTQRQASDARLKNRAEMLKAASGSKRGVKREFDADVESSTSKKKRIEYINID